MKKIAVLSPFARINVEGTSARSLDILLLKKYIELKNPNNLVHFVSKKTRKEHDCEHYIDIESLRSLNFYDSIIIHNYNANIFGGMINDLTVRYIKLLSEFKGKVFYYITDPKMPYFNVAEYLLKRFKTLKWAKLSLELEDLELYASKTKEVESQLEALFTGYNYTPIYNYDFKAVHTVDVFSLLYDKQKIAKSKSMFSNLTMEYDIVYYGDNRGTYRNNKLKYFLNSSSINSLLIGLELPIKGATFMDKKAQTELKSIISNSCLSSLIIGDAEHENAFVTFRFYESLYFDVVCFIDIAYDSNKLLFNHQVLKDFNYIYSSDDLKDKINRLREDNDFRLNILALQKQELLNNPFHAK